MTSINAHNIFIFFVDWHFDIGYKFFIKNVNLKHNVTIILDFNQNCKFLSSKLIGFINNIFLNYYMFRLLFIFN